MSTRRQTRANSRGTPSARGASPPVLNLHNLIRSEVNNTPAGRKNRGESLPVIAPRESTAYGGAGIAKPASIKKTARAPLGTALQNMLEADEEEDELADLQRPIQQQRRDKAQSVTRATPTRARRTPAPRGLEDRENIPRPPLPQHLQDIHEDAELDNREDSPALTASNYSNMFGTPSALNGEAEIRTPRFARMASDPPVARPRGRPRNTPASEASQARSQARSQSQPQPDPQLEDESDSPPEEPQVIHAVFRGNLAPQWAQDASAVMTRAVPWNQYPKHIFEMISAGLKWMAYQICMLFVDFVDFISNNWIIITSFLVAFFACSSCVANYKSGASRGICAQPLDGSSHWYHGILNLGSRGSRYPSHNLTNDNDVMDTIRNLLGRMTTAETDIKHLQRQMSLDHKSIIELENVLPNSIVATRDKSGKVQIPRDFWTALKAKLREESWDFGKAGKVSSPTDVSNIENMAPSLWDEWMEKNEAKIRTWRSEDFEQAYNQHIKASFKNEALVSKSDIVKMLDENYQLSTRDIQHEIKKLTTKLEQEIKTAKADAQKSSNSKADTQKLISEYLQKMLPKAQLDALAEANLRSNLQNSKNRVNHFSMRTGAIIMPRLTAPSYDFRAKRGSWSARKFLSILGRGLPAPNLPTDALTPWEEHGDCWCAPGPPPSTESKGMYPQLGVLTGNNFYPDEIIIEHIPQTGTLNPGTTPRELEVFAYIEDGYSRGPLIQQGFNLMPHSRQIPISLEGYVRIAKFTYDRNGPSVQAFQPQVMLRDFVGRLGPEYINGDAPDTLRPFTRKIVVRALSNYNEGYTCFYRVRVHGEIAEDGDLEEVLVEEGGFEEDEVVSEEI